MRVLTILIFSSICLFGLKLTKSGDYVIDDSNKLMWQDTEDNIRITVTQEQAIEYCEELSINRFSDWRIPTVEEYKLIIDKKRKKELKINRVFRYKLADNYWTGDRTWTRNFGKYGYYIFFKSGSVYYQNRTYPMYVRCVRDMN